MSPLSLIAAWRRATTQPALSAAAHAAKPKTGARRGLTRTTAAQRRNRVAAPLFPPKGYAVS